MEYSEQIQIYFDHYLNIHQHIDELQDFHEPPLRLHKFVQLCQHRNQCNNNNNNNNNSNLHQQNNQLFNNGFNYNESIISTNINKDFKNYLTKNNQNIK